MPLEYLTIALGPGLLLTPVFQENVIELFQNIAENNFTVVYLTARSMAQDSATRKYLFEVSICRH